MIPKAIDDITEADLQDLIRDGVQEGRQLDYKAQLPLASKDDKQEFLRDVTAFANTVGGDLIFGIEEGRDADGKTTGIAQNVVGLTGTADQLIQQLEQLIRNQVDPRIIGLRVRTVPLASGRHVLVVRVPASFSAPHMITQGSSDRTNSRFYLRHAAGKQPMDVNELRNAFVRSEGMQSRLQRWREERLNVILSDASPAGALEGGRLVVQLVPSSAFTQESTFDITEARQRVGQLLHPLGQSSGHLRFNFEGFANGFQYDGQVHWYTQLFRNGAVEAVSEKLTRPVDDDQAGQPSLVEFVAPAVVRLLVQGCRDYVTALRTLGLATPVYVLVSVINVRGTAIALPRGYLRRNPPVLDRQHLLLPEVAMADFDESLKTLMRPLCDLLWQAYGQENCPPYDQFRL